MKYHLFFWSLFLSLFILFSCKTAKTVDHEIERYAGPDISLEIRIPQLSGLAFVNYKKYCLYNDSLFVIESMFRPSLDSNSFNDAYLRDTVERYSIEPKDLYELKDLILKTDTLGSHLRNRDISFMMFDYPRFYIETGLDQKIENGFIGACYRAHIFVFVDFLNKVYPKGKVLPYDKEQLIKVELIGNQDE